MTGMLLARHPFFSALTPDILEVATRIVRPASYQDGEILFLQGAAAESVIFIMQGRVLIRAQIPGGGEEALATLQSGEVVGELGLMQEHRRAASAQAVGRVEVAIMDRNDLFALCATYHPASLHLMQRLAEITARRLRNTTERAAHLVVNSPQQAMSGIDGVQAGAHFEFEPFLSQLAFFRAFTEEERLEFVAMCEAVTVSQGCRIREPGDEDRSLYIILRGAVQTCLVTPDGIMRTGTLGPGRAFGDVGWMLARGIPVCVNAVSLCTCLRLPASSRDRLSDPSSRLSFRFHQGILESLQVKLDSQSRDFARRKQILASGARRWQSGHSHPTLKEAQGEAIDGKEES